MTEILFYFFINFTRIHQYLFNFMGDLDQIIFSNNNSCRLWHPYRSHPPCVTSLFYCSGYRSECLKYYEFQYYPTFFNFYHINIYFQFFLFLINKFYFHYHQKHLRRPQAHRFIIQQAFAMHYAHCQGRGEHFLYLFH